MFSHFILGKSEIRAALVGQSLGVLEYSDSKRSTAEAFAIRFRVSSQQNMTGDI